MAERRMFAKTIIDSDAFLDMPLSSQALYFHLSMRADDEGFINNPKKLQRMIGASDDDMKILIAKSFIIKFDTGIIVIKHWKIHNYIRGDRLQATKYQDERQLLDVKENGAYTLSENLNEISSVEKRKIAYKESELPYCFTYKIRRAFEGKKCPVCGCVMHSNNKLTMPTIQHCKPISKGGEHTLDNIAVICESCNTSIKDKETGTLNNLDVINTWNAILIAEEKEVDWFYHPELLDSVEVSDMCQSNVSQVSDMCQSNVSIGKDRLGKDSIDKFNVSKEYHMSVQNRTDARSGQKNEQKFDWLIAEWNSLKAFGITPITTIGARNSKRLTNVRARLHQYTQDEVMHAIDNIRKSDFLQGKHSGKPWQVTFDWFVLPSNFQKVLEGNYTMSRSKTKAEEYNTFESSYTDEMIEQLEKSLTVN